MADHSDHKEEIQKLRDQLRDAVGNDKVTLAKRIARLEGLDRKTGRAKSRFNPTEESANAGFQSIGQLIQAFLGGLTNPSNLNANGVSFLGPQLGFNVPSAGPEVDFAFGGGGPEIARGQEALDLQDGGSPPLSDVNPPSGGSPDVIRTSNRQLAPPRQVAPPRPAGFEAGNEPGGRGISSQGLRREAVLARLRRSGSKPSRTVGPGRRI